MKLLIALIILFFSLLIACTPGSYEVTEAMKETSDCSTAKKDMNTLEAERASVAKQILVGADNIIPVGAVVRLLRGQWRQGAKISIGGYNEEIRKKMHEINRYCGVPLPRGAQS